MCKNVALGSRVGSALNSVPCRTRAMGWLLASPDPPPVPLTLPAHQAPWLSFATGCTAVSSSAAGPGHGLPWPMFPSCVATHVPGEPPRWQKLALRIRSNFGTCFSTRASWLAGARLGAAHSCPSAVRCSPGLSRRPASYHSTPSAIYISRISNSRQSSMPTLPRFHLR